MTNYSDAMFHYTNADGLHGILSNGEIWSTAYFTTNDASELNTGKGVLTNIFIERTYELFFENHPCISLYRRRGQNIFELASRFENLLFKACIDTRQIYITCFCRTDSEPEFQNGLLSQWRGYGSSNGYALQFSRSKLTKWIDEIHQNGGQCTYSLDDVHYSFENEHKDNVLLLKEAYLEIYMNYLDKLVKMEQELGALIGLIDVTPDIPSGSSIDEAVRHFVQYRSLTKNKHFSEENECRLIANVTNHYGGIHFFNRNGVLVPYIKTPKIAENFLDCIEGIIVSPGANQEVRYQSVKLFFKSLNMKIDIRLSQIPYTGT